MGKYPISPEFRPFDKFRPPVSRPFLALARGFMGEPGFLRRDPELNVEDLTVRSSGGNVPVLLISPKDLHSPAPCLFYVHGGGFVLEAAYYHYALAMRYARECRCRVAFVRYRLAPRYPLPAPYEDCLAAYTWLLEGAAGLGIDRGRVAVAGDSAGAALAVGTALALRDLALGPGPIFQMLPYPLLDLSNSSPSARLYTDTPMWNSRLSSRVERYIRPDRSSPEYLRHSPLENPDLSGLPPAYIETAQFDCLHDDGTGYARRLGELGIPAELNETSGTIHGFDIVERSPTALAAVARRVEFMRRGFWGE